MRRERPAARRVALGGRSLLGDLAPGAQQVGDGQIGRAASVCSGGGFEHRPIGQLSGLQEFMDEPGFSSARAGL